MTVSFTVTLMERRPLRLKPIDGGAGHEHRQAAEHERRAEDGSGADLAAGVAAQEGEGHDGEEGLGQRRADRGQHAADRPLAEAVAAAEPLDRVREQLRRRQDDEEREDEEDDGHRSPRKHSTQGARARGPAPPASRAGAPAPVRAGAQMSNLVPVFLRSSGKRK